MFASPYAVKLLNGCLQKLWRVSKYTGLEVPSVSTFHPDTGSGQVGRSDIRASPVENQYIEVNTRTKHHLHTAPEHGEAGKLLSEYWPRLFSVNQTHLDATTH